MDKILYLTFLHDKAPPPKVSPIYSNNISWDETRKVYETSVPWSNTMPDNLIHKTTWAPVSQTIQLYCVCCSWTLPSMFIDFSYSKIELQCFFILGLNKFMSCHPVVDHIWRLKGLGCFSLMIQGIHHWFFSACIPLDFSRTATLTLLVKILGRSLMFTYYLQV